MTTAHSKRQSLSTTVLFGTTFTRTIMRTSSFFLYPLDYRSVDHISILFLFLTRCEALDVKTGVNKENTVCTVKW